jgi:tetratricopeptide (TPR) repeat protein
MPEIQGMALHSRAALAHQRGEKQEAVQLLHEALKLTNKPSEREVVLGDIAVGFAELGMTGAARDSYLVLTVTAQTKWVSWTATINLMELASRDGMQAEFDNYAEQLRQAPMGPWLRAHYLLFFGEGLERFGRYEAATELLDQAFRYASANQIHAVAFRAEDAMVAIRSNRRTSAPAPVFDSVPQEVLAAACSISELRKGSLTPA